MVTVLTNLLSLLHLNRMPKATELLTFEVYRDVDKQWRWRLLRKAFGKVFIVADSAEAYHNKTDCTGEISSICKTIIDGNHLIEFTP